MNSDSTQLRAVVACVVIYATYLYLIFSTVAAYTYITKKRTRDAAFGVGAGPGRRISLRGRRRTIGRRDHGFSKWEETKYPVWHDSMFLKHFRMGRVHFDELLVKLNQHSPHPRNALRLALCLFKFAHGSPDNVVGSSFDVISGSVHYYIWPVIKFLHDVLLEEEMPLLSHARLDEALNSFAGYERSIPGIIGVVDGIQIRIMRPRQHRKEYWNYKHSVYTLGCQGIAMGNLEFLDFATGYPGSMNDAGIWHRSDFGRAWQDNEGPLANIVSTYPRTFSFQRYNRPITYRPLILADGAYPLLTNMIKPYGRRAVLPHQTDGDKLICGRRATIERAFGVLVMRFGILRKGLFYSPHRSVIVINSCVALHNFLCRRSVKCGQYIEFFKRAAERKLVRIYRNVRPGPVLNGNGAKEFRDQLVEHWFTIVNR